MQYDSSISRTGICGILEKVSRLSSVAEVKKLSDTLMEVRRVNCLSRGGKAPSKRFADRSNTCRLVKSEIESGMFPVRVFLDKENVARFLRLLMEVGIFPRRRELLIFR